MDADLILALNRAGPALPIDRNRATEISSELAQFHQAAEAARKRTAFNVDPNDFKFALEELAGAAR